MVGVPAFAAALDSSGDLIALASVGPEPICHALRKRGNRSLTQIGHAVDQQVAVAAMTLSPS